MLLKTQIQYIKDKSQKTEPSYVQFTYTYIDGIQNNLHIRKYDNQQDNQNRCDH